MAFLWFDGDGRIVQAALVNDTDRPPPKNAGAICISIATLNDIKGRLDRYRVIGGVLMLDGIPVPIQSHRGQLSSPTLRSPVSSTSLPI